MASSIELADIVADALGERRPRVQLALKHIRTDHITFKGYGRGAAAMTAIDAARLTIAVAGSVASDALGALERFKDLPPTSAKGTGRTLERFVAELIEALREDERPSGWGDAGGEAALKLMWTDDLKSGTVAAVCRWYASSGKSEAATFSHLRAERTLLDESRLAAATASGRLIRSCTVPTEALRRIAAGL